MSKPFERGPYDASSSTVYLEKIDSLVRRSRIAAECARAAAAGEEVRVVLVEAPDGSSRIDVLTPNQQPLDSQTVSFLKP